MGLLGPYLTGAIRCVVSLIVRLFNKPSHEQPSSGLETRLFNRLSSFNSKVAMELTLDQALQKGIEAHKAGKVQEADRYYTAILKAQPNHPDANHNMGVLAVG